MQHVQPRLDSNSRKCGKTLTEFKTDGGRFRENKDKKGNYLPHNRTPEHTSHPRLLTNLSTITVVHGQVSLQTAWYVLLRKCFDD